MAIVTNIRFPSIWSGGVQPLIAGTVFDLDIEQFGTGDIFVALDQSILNYASLSSAGAFNGSTFLGGTTSGQIGIDPRSARLGGGNMVTVFNTNPTGLDDIVFQITSPAKVGTAPSQTHTIVLDDQIVTVAAGNVERPDVAALTDGRFVITWGRLDGGDTQIYAKLYNANGTPVGTLGDFITVDAFGNSVNAGGAIPVALTGGRFAVLYTVTATDGSTDLYAKVFDSSGVQVVNGQLPAAGKVIDSFGHQNGTGEGIQAIGTPDGGFLVTYTDSGWYGAASANQTDISVVKIASDGTQGLFQRLGLQGVAAGSDLSPDITAIGSNNYVVTYVTNASTYAQLVDGDAVPILGSQPQMLSDVFASVARASSSSLTDNQFVTAWSLNGGGGGVNRFEPLVEAIGDGANDNYIAPASLRASIDGGGGNDILTGGDLNDIIIGGFGNDNLTGLFGDDSITGNDGSDTIFGNGGNDTLSGGANNDTIIAGDGDDRVAGGLGLDSLDGGAGFDTLDYTEFLPGILANYTVDLQTGLYTSIAESETIIGFEAFLDSESSANIIGREGIGTRLEGRGGNDTIRGGGQTLPATANDTILGGNGDDSIIATYGFDSIDAGAGIDTYDGTIWNFSIVYDLIAGTLSNGVDTITIAGFENLSDGSGASFIAGTDGANILNGRGGNDTLFGRGGDDTLIGGTGADSFDGGTENIADFVSYEASTVSVTVYAATPASNGGDAAGDTYTGIEGWILTSAGSGDTFFGGAAAERVFALDGNDVVFGNAGNDQIWAGNGNDFILPGADLDYIDGGDGFDAVFYGDSANGISLNLATNSHSGFAQSDFFLSIEAFLMTEAADTVIGADNAAAGDILYGLGGNDSLSGQGGFDYLLGGDGADTLNGGFGYDLMTGGAGADRFVFNNGFEGGAFASGGEVITDFEAGVDRIAFVGATSGFASFSVGNNLFIQNGGPTGTQGTTTGPTLIYDRTAGALWFDSNGNQAGGLNYLVSLLGTPTLTGADFIVI